MGDDQVRRLLWAVERRELLDERTFEHLDVERALDERDQPGFEAECQRVFDALSGVPVAPEAELRVTELSRAAYLATFAVTDHHELASCVSDDFELLGRALAARFDDPWLNWLWSEYRAHHFPHGRVERSAWRLSDMS